MVDARRAIPDLTAQAQRDFPSTHLADLIVCVDQTVWPPVCSVRPMKKFQTCESVAEPGPEDVKEMEIGTRRNLAGIQAMRERGDESGMAINVVFPSGTRTQGLLFTRESFWKP